MSRQRIVIAEDDEAIRELLKIRLDIAGYYPIPATDGLEALQCVRSMDPAALILDIGLPRLDGFGVMESLKANRQKPLPILVLTARHAAKDVERAITLGAKGFLAKPFNDKDLLARLARMLAGNLVRVRV